MYLIHTIILSALIPFTDSVAQRGFLALATIILIVLSVANLMLEGLQFLSRRLKYLKDWENYLQISLSVLTILVVLTNRFHNCFCPSGLQWQLACLSIFLAWSNFILLIRSVPFMAIPINMLLSISNSFLQVIALPVLLIVSFGIPLFLLFHEPVSCTVNNFPSIFASIKTKDVLLDGSRTSLTVLDVVSPQHRERKMHLNQFTAHFSNPL